VDNCLNAGEIAHNENLCFHIIIIIALFAFMKHQRIQNHLSRSAHMQMSQIQNIYKFYIERHARKGKIRRLPL